MLRDKRLHLECMTSGQNHLLQNARFQDKRMTGMLKIINNRSILQGRSASESTERLNADRSGLVHIRARERQRASFTPTRAQTGVGWWPDEDKKGHLSLIKRATSYEGLQGQRASVLFMSSPYCPAFIALIQHLHYINHLDSYLSQHTYNTGYWKYLHIQTNALEISNLQTVNRDLVNNINTVWNVVLFLWIFGTVFWLTCYIAVMVIWKQMQIQYITTQSQ